MRHGGGRGLCLCAADLPTWHPFPAPPPPHACPALCRLHWLHARPRNPPPSPLPPASRATRLCPHASSCTACCQTSGPCTLQRSRRGAGRGMAPWDVGRAGARLGGRAGMAAGLRAEAMGRRGRRERKRILIIKRRWCSLRKQAGAGCWRYASRRKAAGAPASLPCRGDDAQHGIALGGVESCTSRPPPPRRPPANGPQAPALLWLVILQVLRVMMTGGE